MKYSGVKLPLFYRNDKEKAQLKIDVEDARSTADALKKAKVYDSVDKKCILKRWP